MTHEDIRNLVNECKYPGLAIQVRVDGQRQYIQVTDGKWTGRKWMMSPHMTPGEVVQTVLAAVLSWVEHETRENFTFRERALFNPHLDLATLWDRAEEVKYRDEKTKG